VDDTEEVNVFSDTVEQYTGLTDKNGVKIFEGDVVRFLNDYWDEQGVVEYSVAGFVATALHGEKMFFTGHAPEWEVIGNIHDNPDLLKKGK